jgi:pimeloyl-ACP methyl ester carboxylesterase
LEPDERVGAVPYCAASFNGDPLVASSVWPKVVGPERTVWVTCGWGEGSGFADAYWVRKRAFRVPRAVPPPQPEPEPGGPTRPTTLTIPRPDRSVEVAAGEKASFSVEVSTPRFGPVTGHVVLRRKDKPDEEPLANAMLWEAAEGRTTLTTPELRPGRHLLEVQYIGTDVWMPSETIVLEAFVKHPASINATSQDVWPGESATIDLSLDTEGTKHGVAVISRNGVEVRRVELVAGTARFTLPSYGSGTQAFDVDFLGTDDTAAASTGFTVTSADWIKAKPDVYYATAGKTLVVPGPGVLKNDGVPLADAFADFRDPGHHGGSIAPDGSVRFLAPKSFRGTDTLRYRVKNLAATSGPGRSLDVPVKIIVGDPWIEDVTLEGQRVGSDRWVDASTLDDSDATIPTTTAGDPTRLSVELNNPTTTSRSIKVDVVDDETGASVLEKPATVTLAAGASLDHPVRLSTWTGAYDQKGAALKGPRSWTVKVTPAGAQTMEQVVEAHVRPRPVVLLHGYMSDAVKGWGAPGTYAEHLEGIHPELRTYAVGDGAYPGRMWTGAMENPLATTNTIAENASEAARYVQALRQDTNAHHVDLVAHSMGGLISRYYISELMPPSSDHRPVVGRLIQMGTPNMGSPCADRLVESNSGVLMPASFQLSTYYLNGWFNRNITNLKGVPVSNMVGTGLPIVCSPGIFGDGVVPTYSARWTLPAKDRPQKAINHVDMTTDPEIIRRYLAPRLNDTVVEWVPPADLPGARVADGLTAAAEAAATSTFATTSLEVAPGTTRRWELDVPAGRSFGVTTVPPGAGLRLLDDAGRELARSAPADAAGMVFPSASVADHAAGRAVVEVTNATGRPLDVPLAAWVVGSPVRVSVDPVTVDDGGTAGLTATVHGAAARTVTARVLDEGAEVGEVTLLDDGEHGDGEAGDGRFGGRLEGLEALPDQVVSVVAETTDGSRSATVRIAVEDRPDRPAPPATAPVVVRDPVAQRVVVGRAASFSVAAAGDVSSLRWEQQAPGSSTWRTVSGATTERLAVTARSASSTGTRYRAVLVGPGGSTSSAPATFTVAKVRTTTTASFRVSTRRKGSATVVVKASGHVPRGSVWVHDGSRRIATRTLGSGGKVTVPLPKLRKGTHRLRVSYRGSADALAGWSATKAVRLR